MFKAFRLKSAINAAIGWWGELFPFFGGLEEMDDSCAQWRLVKVG
jgi:hypothetical protein